jgi:hypothetical protein
MNVRRRTQGQPVIAVGCGRRWVSWRCEQLVRVGFDDVSAAKLAGTGDVDLHEVLDLVARGCPPTLAARILAPLTDDDPQALR